MDFSLSAAQIVVSLFLIATILLQQRGTALGSAFGGGGAGGFYSSRRGIEKKLYIGTILLGAAFLALAVAQLVF